MPIEVVGQVGPVALSNGSVGGLRLGREGPIIVADAQPALLEASRSGILFHAGGAASIPASGASAGPVLLNPLGSNVNVCVCKVRYGMAANTWTAGTFYYAYLTQQSTPGTNTAMTTTSGLLGATTPVAKAYASATLSGAATEFLPAGFVLGATSAGITMGAVDNFEGGLILGPGSLITIYTTTADTTPAEHIGFTWIEVPV